MSNDRELIARFEAADAEELARLLVRLSAEEERTLQAYLGPENYRRMRSFALRHPAVAGRRGPGGGLPSKGNVIVLHGIMGGELTAYDRAGAAAPVWLQLWRLVTGGFGWLRLDGDGLKEADPTRDVRASGILKRYYGQLLLALAQNWTVRAFWFDWRKDIRASAAALEAQISGWFGEGAPVHLIAHSMGGLVARALMRAYPERWQGLADPDGSLRRGGRLIMLGTPNFGSFAISQVLTGANDSLRRLALFDVSHSGRDLTAIAQSFAGVYQMLPAPAKVQALGKPHLEKLYDAKTYGAQEVSRRHLEAAREFHAWIEPAVDAKRMLYVAGYNQRTADDIPDLNGQLSDPEADRKTQTIYSFTPDGDGTVPHSLGLLAEQGVRTYYVEEEHGTLPRHPRLIQALDSLLERGETDLLPSAKPASPARGLVVQEVGAPARGWGHDPTQAPPELERAATRMAGRLRGAAVRGGVPTPDAPVGSDERAAEELIGRAFLGLAESDVPAAFATLPPPEPVELAVGLFVGGLDEVSSGLGWGEGVPTPDALAVGHYIGVRPQYAEGDLDVTISSHLLGGRKPEPTELLITQYVERGTLRGELGQPFFIPDPREPGRVIVLAGMGLPGRFGKPELTVLVRELAWALGQLGKRHLASVLIGAGGGYMRVEEGVEAWLRGLDRALSGTPPGEERVGRLVRVTLVENDPKKADVIEQTLGGSKQTGGEQKSLRFGNLQVRFAGRLEGAKQVRRDHTYQGREQGVTDPGLDVAGLPIPTRITVQLEGEGYRFGAITGTAAIPERALVLDPVLVAEINDHLAAEANPAAQLEYGQLLERLLIPTDLRDQFHPSAPLVLLLDADTARLHWEMLAPHGPANLLPGSSALGVDAGAFDRTRFLSTGRGLTRQLRTVFAPPPEPPPPPRRTLRVLVVADPAADMPLAGAQQEGAEVADLFERFNAVYTGHSGNRVEVVRLFGPNDAARVNVIKRLALESWDVLHFAGHCVYDAQRPTVSGWIFSGGHRLTANELSRIDQVPKFVFSNACESGVTPDRTGARTAALAPSFAESFFARGVSNFVCTAWPVDDQPAREFACRLYAALLGLGLDLPQQPPAPAAREPQVMHEAMRDARAAIAEGYGGCTWGAYQHYGSPHFRFFDPASLRGASKGARAIVPSLASYGVSPEGDAAPSSTVDSSDSASVGASARALTKSPAKATPSSKPKKTKGNRGH
jgi:pimeloyl-ACP methyl ester carboxylesterase